MKFEAGTERYRKYHREYQKARRKKNPEKYRKYQNDYLKRLKLKILKHYGGNPPMCACCNEKEIKFLTIDHMLKKEKYGKNYCSGTSLTIMLNKENFPEGFQVLCFNCNLSKGIYGVCPHNIYYG